MVSHCGLNIFLMANDAELIYHPNTLFDEASIQIIGPFFIGMFVFLSLSLESPTEVWAQVLYQILFVNIFSLSPGLSFHFLNNVFRDFPGGTVVKNPPANTGDIGSSPAPGRSHMPWSN